MSFFNTPNLEKASMIFNLTIKKDGVARIKPTGMESPLPKRDLAVSLAEVPPHQSIRLVSQSLENVCVFEDLVEKQKELEDNNVDLLKQVAELKNIIANNNEEILKQEQRLQQLESWMQQQVNRLEGK
uniref:Uncharacterized protein n=1 Tax=Ditylenchus dipsaci TaxID=166011 RepID=A0A915E2V9_9BILA